MPILTSRTARTVIYFGCIGGLLVLNSAVVMFIWNSLAPSLLPITYNLSPITFLEGSGVTAFTYVIAFSIRYGLQQKRASEKKEAMKERCNNMTQEQRDALKHELIASCGCKESEPNAIEREVIIK